MTLAPALVEPAFYRVPEWDYTLGDEVADLAALAGIPPDPEQRLLLDVIFAVRGQQAACMEVCEVAPRQNLKTVNLMQAALGWLYVLDVDLVVWSAHEVSTAEEAHRALGDLIAGNAYLARRLHRVYEGNGKESIELTTGQRLLVKARTKTGGRGLAAPRVVLDEAFALQPAHMGALMPTLSAQADPQLVYASSAGREESEQLRRVRDRGRAGRSPRLGYVEWMSRLAGCADERCEHEWGTPGCEYDERGRWAEANTSLGRVRENGTGISVEYVQGERESLTPHEFGRERLGIWDEGPGTAAAFGPGRWEAVGGRERPEGLRVGGLAVAVSFDLAWACIGSAGVDGDGVVHLRPLAHRPGTDWVVERAVELDREHGARTVVDGKGPAADLVGPLREAGVDVHVADTEDACDAFAWVWKAVRDRAAAHGNYPELDLAAASAVPRSVGDRRVWGRKQSTSDISALEAVTLAGWWAFNHLESGEPLAAWV